MEASRAEMLKRFYEAIHDVSPMLPAILHENDSITLSITLRNYTTDAGSACHEALYTITHHQADEADEFAFIRKDRP